MDIAEKILQLKQDFDNVYRAGQESGGGGVMPYYTFRPASPTREVSFPYENLPNEYSVLITPEKFPTINAEHFAFVGGYWNKAGGNTQSRCDVVLKTGEGLSTSSFNLNYRNNIISISSTHATFLPEYTYNVLVITR